MPNIITLNQVAKSFYLRPVLRSVSLDIRPGEGLFLAGRNGSGKTTLLKIMAGVMRPEGGSGVIGDHPLFTSDGRWRGSLCYLGHHPNLYPSFTATENVRLALRLRGQAWNQLRFDQTMERFGLGGRENEPIRAYSEGMLRRLGLVRLELSDWKLALLDEPGSALDIEGVELLSATLRAWQKNGRAILFTSHDVAWGAATADRCLYLAEGGIAAELEQPQADQVSALLKADK